ncbi:MYBPP protein, partial [Acromyrmex heyeri]
MDFARKIGKPDKPRTWKKTRQPLVTTRDNILSGDTSFSEDHSFINWKKWLADHKKQNRYIEFVTGRSQDEQLQNSSEKFRSFVEMKNLMEQAIPIIDDKYRGRPEFWKTPEFLPDRACLPEISLTLSKKDLTFPSDLMHVGIPDLIAKERDLAPQKKEKFWKRSEYLKTRKLELAEKIALLMPKESEMTTLAIQGHAITYQKKKLSLLRIPPITITESEDVPDEDADQAVILKIQDREFVWQKSLFRTKSVDTDPIIWSLTFTSKINEQIEKEIVLENKGTHVIEYHWRYSSFQTYGTFFEKHDSQFFFDKTKGLILPGQIVKIKVWYRSKTCGVFVEYWRFITDPKLSSSTFMFRFWGYTTDTQNINLIDHQMIDEYLNRCIRDSTIRSIIQEILDRMEHSELPEPPYKMLISQNDLLFESDVEYYNKYDAEENKSFSLNLQLYREIFFIRIYKALEEAIERVCASIDSFHRLNELKFKI